MPDSSLYSKIKDFLPVAAAAGIGALAGGGPGALAAAGGAAGGEMQQQELQQSRAEKALQIASMLQERKAQEQYRLQQEQDRQQQNQFMNQWRLREQQDNATWRALSLDDRQLAEQDRHEERADALRQRKQEHQEHEEDLRMQRASLDAYRGGMLALSGRRTDAYVNRTDSQIKRMDLLNSALVGDEKDYDSYVKALPSDLQAQAKAFSHTPQARTAFMKEMVKREQAEDPTRRNLLIGHAAQLLGKPADELNSEWAGYSGKKVADLTSWLEEQKAKNGGTFGAGALSKAQKAIASQESGMAKDIRSLSDKYDKQFGIGSKLLKLAPNKTEWITRQLASASTMASTPQQAARARRAVAMYVNNKVPLSNAVKMVYGDFGIGDESASSGGGESAGASVPTGNAAAAGSDTKPPVEGAVYGSYKGKPGWFDPKTNQFHPA